MRIFEDICSRRSPRKHRLESADVLAAINEEGLTDCEGTNIIEEDTPMGRMHFGATEI